jgi:hypothetical protein
MMKRARIDPFDFIPNVAVIVFLRELGRSAVRRAPCLRTQLEPLLGRLSVRDSADLDGQPAQLLINSRILQPPI